MMKKVYAICRKINPYDEWDEPVLLPVLYFSSKKKALNHLKIFLAKYIPAEKDRQHLADVSTKFSNAVYAERSTHLQNVRNARIVVDDICNRFGLDHRDADSVVCEFVVK